MYPAGKAVIFSAPSGAGKTTIVRALLNHGLPLEFSVSACSRAPRERERHGKDYYFMTVDEFKTEIDKNAFLEWEEVYPEQYYGTLKAEVERVWSTGRAVIFDVDVHGGLSIKKILGDKALAIFVEPPSVQILETRLRGRSTETEDKIRVRMKKAATELQLKTEFDHVLLNDDLGKAIAEAQRVIEQFFEKK